MKISKKDAVAFLVALGFKKAGEWEDEKILGRLKEAPNRIEKDKVPGDFHEIYDGLANSEGKVSLIGGAAPKAEKKEKPAKEKKEKAPKAEKAEKPAKAPKAEKKEKPAKEKKEKAPKAEKKEPIERDDFGSRKGTISAKVNAILGDEWNDEVAIAKEAGVTLDQARGRLYYAQQEGVIECRRLVQYRLVKKGKK